MSQLSKTIPKHPELKPAEDFYRLRREGIGFIEKMGSSLWTDYNIHDPGITILEALCYAITDLVYRTGWDIKDILSTPASDPKQLFPNQAFFTARDILTVNPWTPDDFRRLLIDLESVRNAWVFCRECGCDAYYYAWCEEEKNQLKLSYQEPDKKLHPQKVEPRGLYDVLLELEADPELGDLNDHKVEYTTVVTDKDGVNQPITMELRFPGRSIENSEEWESFQNDLADFTVTLKRFGATKSKQLGATKTFDVFTDPSLKTDEERDEYIRRHWRGVFYLDIGIQYSGKSFTIENVTMLLLSDAAARHATTAIGLKDLFEKVGVGKSVIRRYRDKTTKAKKSIASAKAALRRHRNLDEDYCRVKVVNIEEVAVCADVEVKSDADIEWVQARIWFEIERYFNPPVPFYTLQELMDAGEPVEEIFNGPELNSGFIKRADMEAASLKSVLRVSDIINLLMDIEGVIAVNQLQLTKYDAEGHIVRGAADPSWSSEGKPIFDANKISASWLLYISDQRQPRLYLNDSRFLFYKNGLPFQPRMNEARDALTQLRGEAERPKVKSAPKDLPVPAGKYCNPDDYYPVQYSFPLTYGIGQDGLPLYASDERRAQAKQMKAYLMVFEQILGNAFAQVARSADLFSLDPDITRTYFVREFSEAVICGYDAIITGLNESVLEAMTENRQEFLERRNRFLDHIMARFGEQFREYALVLTNLQGRQVALDKLIQDRASFLKAYPVISHDRARAFDYSRRAPFDYFHKQVNQPGIKRRVSLLLGYPDVAFDWEITDLGVDKFRLKFQLNDKNKEIFSGYLTLAAPSLSEAEANELGHRAVIKRMSLPENYKIAEKAIADAPDKFALRLTGRPDNAHGRYPDLFDTKADAAAMRDELVAWSANERMIIVEHLLLRPKFPGDALYPVCSEGKCAACGDEDPYSFRMTFVMPGWIEPFKTNMEMRDFAERTIRQEMPAHLLGKICWVDRKEFEDFEKAWFKWLEANAKFDWTEERLQERVETILAKNLLPIPDKEESTENALCKCATAILMQYGMEFYEWMEKNFNAGKTLDKFSEFKLEHDLKLCNGFTFKDSSSTAKALKTLLHDRYNTYKEVSYRLRVVVDLLSRLNNIYPPATLHDCNEGNDQNQVRLGKTALGGN